MFLSGGAAAYLIGRFNEFDDVDIFICPKPGGSDERKKKTHDISKKLLEQKEFMVH